MAIWIDSLSKIHVARVNDLGLVSVLPAETFAAFAVLTVSFAFQLARRRVSHSVALVHLVTLIFMLYGITNFVEDVPRFAVTWRHVGIAQFLMTTGQVDPQIDAYFNWPGFFALAAFLTKVAGFHSPLALARWAPVYYNLLYLAPLLMIFRTLSVDRRVWWLGTWLFYVTDWIGQDYFSPQGLTYFLYLVVLAAVLQWFVPSSALPPGRLQVWLAELRSHVRPRHARAPLRPLADETDGTEVTRPSRARAGVILVSVAIFAAIVPSHQLTPFAVLSAVALLVLVGRATIRATPVLMSVLVASWLTFVAVAYLSGHRKDVTGHAGNIEGTFVESLANRLTGSALHLLVVADRLAITTVLWSLAALSALLAYRRRIDIVPCVVLALAPFPLIGLQAYGGEILLRVYLFSLPFMVFLVAILCARAPQRAVAPIFAGVLLFFLSGFVIARFGNERMDYFARDEVAAVTRLYDVAPPGSGLFALVGNLPWKFQNYTSYRYARVTPELDWGRIDKDPQRSVRSLAALMTSNRRPAYLILTRSQSAAAELADGVSPRTIVRFERAIANSPRFREIYRSPNARIFMLRRSSA